MSANGNSKSSDWKVRGPVESCTIPCLVDWDCVDITAQTENYATYTHVYCGVGTRRTLYATLEQNPADNTLTIQSPEEHVRKVIRRLAKNGCYTGLQRVHCSGHGEHYRMVNFNSNASTTRLTAKGVNATDEVILRDLSTIYRDTVYWGTVAESKPALYITSRGRYFQAPTGRIDGVNATFVLDPAPYTDEEFGRPVLVWLDGVLQVEGTDYTLTDGVIVFDTPPACPEGDPTGYLTVLWYTKEYLIYGKKPVAVWFCDSPSCGYGDGACGGPCSDGCRWVHALFESDILTELDVCGTGDTQRYGIVATFEHKNDLIRFADADVLKDAGVAGVVDGICSTICNNQTSVIASFSTLWEGSGQSWLDSNAPIPSGSFVKKLAYSNYTDETYALFGNQGVLKRGSDGWFATKQDVVAGDVHVAIDANGCVVATVGAGTMSYSRDDGRSWTTVTLPIGETGLDVGIGIPHELSITEGVIYVLTANATRTTLWVTGDYGRTWLRRHVWATVPVCNAQIEVAADDWFIYVHLDNETWRNTNYGCDQCGAWEKLADDAPCDSILAVCHHEPDVSIIIGVKYGAVDDFFQVLNTGTTLIPVLFNDVSLPPGCTLDATSVLLTANFDQGTGTVEVTGEIEVDAGVGPLAGTDFGTYTVEANCADGTTLLYTANVVIQYIAPLP